MMRERATAVLPLAPRRRQSIYVCGCGSIWRSDDLTTRVCERCKQHPVKQAAGWNEAADP